MALSQDDFEVAAKTLAETWRAQNESGDWQDVRVLRQHGESFLRIMRQLPDKEQDSAGNEESAEVEEDDDEAIVKTPAAAGPTVIYDIVYSPTYQVPVLYLTIKHGIRMTADEIRDLLVPSARKAQINAVGIVGALSITDHPMLGVPAYFVHPCRTQEAMEPLLKERSRTPVEYLMLWFGVIGGSVGLDIPVPLAEVL